MFQSSRIVISHVVSYEQRGERVNGDGGFGRRADSRVRHVRLGTLKGGVFAILAALHIQGDRGHKYEHWAGEGIYARSVSAYLYSICVIY